MSSRKASDPGSFEPGPVSLVVRPRSLSVGQRAPADGRDDRNNRRRRSSSAWFQSNVGAEALLDIHVGRDGNGSESDGIRRRILVEPNFSLQEKSTGAAENRLRQIVFDQGISDESLVKEIQRGADNAYQLGTLQRLRNVHDYVDYGGEALVSSYIREHAVGNLLLSNTFRYMILFVILLNTVLIGIDTNPQINIKYGRYLEATENLIMGAFILEILIKWYYHFDVFWRGGWNILDFLIICVLFFGSNLRFLSTSRVLRILRVVRAFRSLRDTPLFSGLSLIFDTIARSMWDMVNICLLMVIIIFLLAVVGVQLFGEFAPDAFGSFSTAVFSIFICQTQRGWVDVMNPFHEAGAGYFVGGFVFFLLTITLTSFVLKNMFVAVIVSNLKVEMKLTKEERERKAAKRENKPAVKSDEEGEEDDEDGAKLEPMIEAARGWRAGEVQRRIVSPMFLHTVPLEELQKFLFLQAALEDNLSRYRLLRVKLQDLASGVRSLNPNYFHSLARKSAFVGAANRKLKM